MGEDGLPLCSGAARRKHILRGPRGPSLMRFSLTNSVIHCRLSGAGRILSASGPPRGEPRLRRWILILIACLPLLVARVAVSQTPPPAGGEFDDLLHQGFDFHQHNDYAHALPLLRRAWKLQPHDYFVNLLLGIDLLRTGKGADALGFLREAARARPQEEFPCEYLGEAEAGLKHYEAAMNAYACALRVAPQSSQAAVAYVDYSLGRFVEIAGRLRSTRPGLAAEYRLQALAHPLGDSQRLQLLQRSVDLDSQAPGIWSELALAQAGAGQLGEAEASLEKAQRENAKDPRAWEAAALLAAQKDEWAGAAEWLNKITLGAPGVLVRALSEWPATLLPAGKEISGRAAVFLECVSTRCGPEGLRLKIAARPAHEQRNPAAAAPTPPVEPPTDPRKRGLQGAISSAESEDCPGAIPALEGGLRTLSQAAAAPARVSQEANRSGKNPEVYAMFLLSWCYAQQASAVADRMKESPEDEAQLHMMRGDVLLRLQGNSAAAASEYRSALAMRPNDPEILQRLAEAQLGAGQTAEAAETAQRALALDPHRMPAMRTLAKIDMEKRDYAGALQYLRPLAAADPADLATRIQLGTACAETGALDEALQNLSPTLRRGYPDEKGSLHYLLGTVLRKLGKTSEANAAFAASKELSDNFQRNSHRDETESESHP